MSDRLEEMGAFFDARSETYDEVHVGHIDGGIEGKRVTARYLPEHCRTLLDLGIGTGLELESIFARFPEISVTGIDLSAEMLRLLRGKYPEKQLDLHQMSYFDYDMGEDRFDAGLTVMTLHHYTHEVKTDLYRRILRSLKPGGVYIESDYMIPMEEEDPQGLENFYFAEYERLKKEQGLDQNQEYHYDTPCTVANQKKMLRDAGFSQVEEVWRQGFTAVLVAKK